MIYLQRYLPESLNCIMASSFKITFPTYKKPFRWKVAKSWSSGISESFVLENKVVTVFARRKKTSSEHPGLTGNPEKLCNPTLDHSYFLCFLMQWLGKLRHGTITSLPWRERDADVSLTRVFTPIYSVQESGWGASALWRSSPVNPEMHQENVCR